MVLTLVDLAAWISRHSVDFPIVQQLPEAPPVSLLGSPDQMQIQMFGPPPLPRLLLRSNDQRSAIQIQNDRFALSWHRTEPLGDPTEYPGFDAQKAIWRGRLDDFESYARERFGQAPKYRLIELSYVNAAPLLVGGKARRISEVFKFIRPEGRRLGAFNVMWTEPILPAVTPDENPGVITCQFVLGTAPPAIPVLAYTFTGLISVTSGKQYDVLLDIVHSRIREIYETVIFQDVS